MKPVREPGAANPHAGFDEKERETEMMAVMSETPERKTRTTARAH